MKLVFLSNYYSHHQKPTCEAWYRYYGNDFAFVSTEAISEERLQMGWHDYQDISYEIRYDKSDPLPFDLNSTHQVILGNAPLSIVEKRLREGKIVFKYSERIFKQGYNYVKWIPRIYTYWRMYGRYSSLYLLAASAYATGDFNMHGTFLGKSYKWGYFPETRHYEEKKLLEDKKQGRILWCARFLGLKHPEVAIEIAKRLKASGYDFHLDMIGAGELEESIRDYVQIYRLNEEVTLLGAMTPEQVRAYMEEAQIFLFTSDFNEGWGAVLNEAMNSGCAVVASHAIGSVPFLIRHGENGLIYENGNIDDLYRKVKMLLEYPRQRCELGRNAYRTIVDVWNAETAAQRFVVFSKEIEKYGYCNLFEDGPCSPAPALANNWFRKDKYDVSWIKD